MRKRIKQPLHVLLDLFSVRCRRQNDDEHPLAQSGEMAVSVQEIFENGRRLDHDLFADAVTEGILDDPQVFKFDMQNRYVLRFFCVMDDLIKFPYQHIPVRQFCGFIEIREVVQSFFVEGLFLRVAQDVGDHFQEVQPAFP